MGSRVDEPQCAEPAPTDTDAEKGKTDSEEDPWDTEDRAYLIVETANVTSLVSNQEQMHTGRRMPLPYRNMLHPGRRRALLCKMQKRRDGASYSDQSIQN